MARQTMYGSNPYKMLADCSTFLLAVWLFVFAFKLDAFIPHLTQKSALSGIGQFLDRNSFYLYTTSCFFCLNGKFDVFNNHNSTIVSILAYVLVTIVSSFVLKFVSLWIESLIGKTSKGQ